MSPEHVSIDLTFEGLKELNRNQALPSLRSPFRFAVQMLSSDNRFLVNWNSIPFTKNNMINPFDIKGKLEKCGYFLVKQTIPQTGFQGCLAKAKLEFKGVRGS